MKIITKAVGVVVWTAVGVAVLAVFGLISWCEKHLEQGA